MTGMVDLQTNTGDVSPIASGFPEPSLEGWERLAEAALKGRSLDALGSRTADGVAFGPLHVAAPDFTSARVERAPGDSMRPWDARTLVAHPSPDDANAQALEDLAQGAASVLLRLQSTDCDGIVCNDESTLARVLQDVQTELAPVALSAPSRDLEAATWLSRAARRGPAARLAFHMDPLGAFARSGVGEDMDVRLESAGRLAVGLVDTHPLATAFLASGQVVHEAGGTEAQELGFAAACALAYARSAAAAGLDEGRALASVAFGCAADPRTFLGIAKVRALRMVAQRLSSACGRDGPVTIEARAGERTLSTLDCWTNLLRLTAAASGAVLGGADAIVVPPFTIPLTAGAGPPPAPPPAPPAATDDRFARRQARNVHLVLMEEAHLGRVEDPAGGSWFLEHLTVRLAQAAWAAMQVMERAGGALAILREGAFAAAVRTARDALDHDYARGVSSLIGVTENRAPVETRPTIDVAPRPTECAEAARGEICASLTPWRAAFLFESATQ